jgi:hypothetical protein
MEINLTWTLGFTHISVASDVYCIAGVHAKRFQPRKTSGKLKAFDLRTTRCTRVSHYEPIERFTHWKKQVLKAFYVPPRRWIPEAVIAVVKITCLQSGRQILAFLVCRMNWQPLKFQGEQVYGTICGGCHNKSERSTDFLELEINIEVIDAPQHNHSCLLTAFVQNNARLEDRIAALLQNEKLTGDNKFESMSY